jgi:long-chain acyl-CoA synthetase/crotonobetaine/carnitine-CoA ligase
MHSLVQNLEADDIPETLGALVRECAQRSGEQILATWFEDNESITYRQLDESADRLASSLLALGVRKGTHVAVMLPNIRAFPVTWVAIGRIGAVMVPVNTAYTGEEVHFVLSDSDAQFLVIDATLLPVFTGMEKRPPLIADAQVIVHGAAVTGHQDWQALVDSGSAPFEAPSAVGRNDLLNIQYTSGTTGFPKGCMLPHDYWMIIGTYATRFREDPRDIRNVLIWAPFFYMDPMWQFLMTMRLGATAHIARRFSLSRFYTWLKDFEINYCIFPEPALKVREPSPGDRELALKYVSIYGWRAEARAEVQERFGVMAREGYGMTEIGGAAVVPESASDMALQMTCGLPGPFRELKIVDEEGNEVPVGERGELWVSGRSILWGYYKRPVANAESFRGRWFRTGDIFYRDDRGYHYIVGRIKDMIRRAGENISAHEVEKALCAMEGIEEAAAVPAADPLRREEVKVFLLLKEGITPEACPPEAIIEHCRKRLAPFKVPRYISYVSDFPRTASRKIQKQKLLAGSPDQIAGCWDRETGKWN